MYKEAKFTYTVSFDNIYFKKAIPKMCWLRIKGKHFFLMPFPKVYISLKNNNITIKSFLAKYFFIIKCA